MAILKKVRVVLKVTNQSIKEFCIVLIRAAISTSMKIKMLVRFGESHKRTFAKRPFTVF